MKAKHTETPWEDTGNSEMIKIQQATTLEVIAFIKPGYPMNEANAKHIVKCVNCHDGLVEALEDTLKSLCNACTGKDHCNIDQEPCCEYKYAKKALKNAEEE